MKKLDLNLYQKTHKINYTIKKINQKSIFFEYKPTITYEDFIKKEIYKIFSLDGQKVYINGKEGEKLSEDIFTDYQAYKNIFDTDYKNINDVILDNKKELQIEESPLFKSSKMLNFAFGTPIESNIRTLKMYLAQINIEELKEFNNFLKLSKKTS